MRCFLLYSLLFIFAVHCDDNPPLVNAPIGRIQGYHKLSFNERKFSAFEGIPFAKPPIGQLRFKEPEPVEPWSGTWHALSSTECVQTNMMNTNIAQGQEDCLYLNVYVPREVPNPDEKLDVIVHIHGGAFLWGSGHAYAHPEYLMDRDIIFVTMNYRLGFFGFLSTEDNVVPGNNGLKDQVLALKWIQENIQSFGGNPDSVTLTGISAGGASVHFHYFSPLSKGLFHKGISQSGVALNPWALQEEPLKKAQTLAAAVGCSTANNKKMIECLRQRPLKQLLTKTSLFYEYKFMPYCPFAPVIEHGGKKPFLDNLPYFLLATNKIHDLPWIASTVEHEGLFPGVYIKEDLDLINSKWSQLAPYLLEFNYTLAKSISDVTSKEIRTHYFGEEDINNESFYKLVKMFTDRLFMSDSTKAAKLQAKVSKSNVYYYQFSYPYEENPNKTVAHGEDGQYQFYKMYARQPTKNDLKMKDLILDMMVSFAKTGKPEIEGVTWEPTGYRQLTYINITGFEPEQIKKEVATELGSEKFWTSLGFFENENLVLLRKDEL